MNRKRKRKRIYKGKICLQARWLFREREYRDDSDSTKERKLQYWHDGSFKREHGNDSDSTKERYIYWHDGSFKRESGNDSDSTKERKLHYWRDGSFKKGNITITVTLLRKQIPEFYQGKVYSVTGLPMKGRQQH